MRIFGDLVSGNCLKVKWTADVLGLPYQWVDVDIMKDEARTPAFLAMNPAGQVPCVLFEDGRTLAQSNAIIRYLARGSRLIPADPFAQAKMDEWLFWEQYSHEPYIAVARFQLVYLGKSPAELDEKLKLRGEAALALLDKHLADRRWLVGESASLADVALVAYTRWAEEGGFALGPYAHLRRWIQDCEADFVSAPLRDAQ